METIGGVEVLDVRVDPMKGWSNTPHIHIWMAGEPPQDSIKVWRWNGGYYWYQDEDGLTRFLAHKAPTFGNLERRIFNPDTQQWETDTIKCWHTPKSDGFGGSEWELKMRVRDILPESEEDELVNVLVRGPWSGGCYGANTFLPQKATEFVWNQDGMCGLGGYNLEFARMEVLLNKFLSKNWSIGEQPLGGLPSPEPRYANLPKTEWSVELMEDLYVINETKRKVWDKHDRDSRRQSK